MRLFRLSLLTLIFGLLLLSCSDDKKDNTTGPAEEPPETVTVETIEVPQAMQQSTDQYAQLTVQYIQLVNYLQQLAINLQPPAQMGKVAQTPLTNDGPPWIYTWTDGTITATLTITIEDNLYHWKLTYSGIIEGVQFDNVTVFEAWADQDGTYGKFIWYDTNTKEKIAEWVWDKDDQGVLSFTYTDYENGDKIIIKQNPDLSGVLEVYENNLLTFKAQWNADGSGSWWTYENGSLTDSGTWT